MDVVNTVSPGTWKGRLAPATATIPVPITEANQFGPTEAKASAGAVLGAAYVVTCPASRGPDGRGRAFAPVNAQVKLVASVRFCL